MVANAASPLRLDVSDADHVVASLIQLAKVDADELDNRLPCKRNEMFLMNENATCVA